MDPKRVRSALTCDMVGIAACFGACVSSREIIRPHGKIPCATPDGRAIESLGLLRRRRHEWCDHTSRRAPFPVFAKAKLKTPWRKNISLQCQSHDQGVDRAFRSHVIAAPSAGFGETESAVK